MRRFLASVSVAFLAAGAAFAADTPYWIEPCVQASTGCVPGDMQLARWALEAWQDASNGRLHFVPTPKRADAVIRVVWATRKDGLYGEAMPIEVNGKKGAQIFVRIAVRDTHDALLRDTIVYLTCLHESGHALGLPHTDKFDDIMYSFQYGGNIPEYFARYRRKLTVRDDIRKNPGLSAADRDRIAKESRDHQGAIPE
jgi:Matrixin